jgi:hypothetical protein
MVTRLRVARQSSGGPRAQTDGFMSWFDLPMKARRVMRCIQETRTSRSAPRRGCGKSSPARRFCWSCAVESCRRGPFSYDPADKETPIFTKQFTTPGVAKGILLEFCSKSCPRVTLPVSILVRVLRQFAEGAEVVMLEKTIVMPDTSTMGTRLDLRREGVETALTVVGVTLRPIVDGPGIRPPSVEVVLYHEPLASAELASSAGWRDPAGSGA